MDNSKNIELINCLLRGQENECLEFKENNLDPKLIGKLCSALSNSARIQNKKCAYVLWGVNDERVVVGTNFCPDDKKIVKMKLAVKLNPVISCNFNVVDHPGGRVVILEIPAAILSPIAFDGTAYVRVGSATTKLADHLNKMQILMKNLQAYTWEKEVAKNFLDTGDVLNYLDYEIYFQLTKQSLPQGEDEILQYLANDKIIERDNVKGKWNILNLGALLLAKDLKDFDSSLARKGVRFVAYEGNNRSNSVTHRVDGEKGYAMALEGLVTYINNVLPNKERINEVYREVNVVFPKIAIREIIANALIHQDMTVTGTGPQIELFTDRLEIVNPGKSINPAERMIDLPPISRNEGLANLMRRMRLCEEQGSGIDKVVYSVEEAQLPAPKFQLHENSTQVILYSYRSFADLTIEERARACYQHAVIKYISGMRLKNASLCTRFGIKKGNESQVSKVIKDALSKKLIKFADPDSPRSGYYPFWG